MSQPAAAQSDIKIWEFSPYEVEVFYIFDTDVGGSPLAQRLWLAQVQADLERTFRAAWHVQLTPLRSELAPLLLRRFDSFTVADLQAQADLTEASSDASKDGESKPDVASSRQQSPSRQTEPAPVAEATGQDGAGGDAVEAEAGAELRQVEAERVVTQVSLDSRAGVPSTQSRAARRSTLWHERDKLFFLRVSRQGDELRVQVRELDGPLLFFGPTLEATTEDWSYAARLAATAIADAFAPVARVEDATSRTADLRLRAGGLILPADNQPPAAQSPAAQSPAAQSPADPSTADPSTADPSTGNQLAADQPVAVVNPAAIVVGDVMQPVVRRDDRNGVPVLLQPLPWTYAAVTASDGVKLQANVYTYSGGPGLQGRKNRRTQRLLLKVRPQSEQTDLELVLRNSGQPQAGCFIYSRDLVTDQFDLLGRTDWRGRLTIAQPLLQVELLPEAVRAARAAAKRAATAAAESAAAQAQATSPDANGAEASDEAGEPSDEPSDGPSDEPSRAASESPDANASPEQGPSANDAAVLVQDDAALIPLRAPLMLLYVKQGSAVLAKLPIVPGMAQVETAELPDDRRRLLAEAFVRGFQGEILDVVGMRNLLAAKVKQQMARDHLDAAKATVEELRQLKNYTQLADELEGIQRRMLDETDGPIPLAAKSRIDGMFQATRTMLQKYLQDNLLTESEQAVAAAAQSEPSVQP